MGLDIPAGTPNRGPGFEAYVSMFLGLTTLMSLVRVISKVFTKQRWWWDDLFALLSWVSEVIILSLLIYWVSLGFGLHEEFIAAQDENDLIIGGRGLYAGTLFFDSSICFPKLSALFFYARVFNIRDRTLRLQLWIIGILVVCWLISSWIVTIWQCDPIAKAWNPSIPGKCIKTYPWFIATATISFAIDIWILIIPIPLIWALKSSLRRRIYLLVAFFLTYSVIVASAGRLIAITQVIPTVAEDETWRMPTYMYWICLEGSLSVISISVPNAIALWKHFRGSRGSMPSTKNSNSRSFNTTSEFGQIHNFASVCGGPPSISESSDKRELLAVVDRNPEMAQTPGNIRVMTDIRVDCPSITSSHS
ncbi:hypothetical protein N7456_007275 [Penicillium angulare]|uniref:Rhodopsin domain-containing protein n=1 Tax=Penicillium angulare TaxID=116970 RepID=A0A9W9FJE7_9EURO|nr:hypothetical protein N7456_007275 [Penicillium angulare]